MSHRIMCDSCEDYIKAGGACIEVRKHAGKPPFPATSHYHELCWDRQLDVLMGGSQLNMGQEVTLVRRSA